MQTGQPQLERAIGRWSLTALVVNSVIGSAVFGMPSLIAGLVGDASPWAYLAAAVPMAIIIACFAEVSSQFTAAGGPYLYAHAAFGRFAAILMGWLAFLVRITATAANSNLFVIYLGEFWPGATRPVGRAAALGMLIGSIALANYRGVRSGTRISNLFTWAKMLPLALLIVAGLWHIWFRQAAAAHQAQAGTTATWIQAILLLVFAYGGFESALMPMGEARDPRRDAPFALFAALVLCIVFYALVQYVVIRTLPDAAGASRPLAAVAQVIMGNAGSAFLAVTGLLALYGYVSAQMLNAPRLPYALAENGDFPPVFAAIHPRFHTPHVSILAFAVVVAGLAVAGSFRWNLTLSAVARLFTYGMVCAALLVLRRKQPGRIRFRVPAGPLVSGLGIGFTAYLMTRMGKGEAQILGATVAIAFLTWLWARRAHPRPRRGDAEAQGQRVS